MALRTVLFLITNLVVVLTISILLQIATAAGLLPTDLPLLPLLLGSFGWGVIGAWISLLFSRQSAIRSMGVQVLEEGEGGSAGRWLRDTVAQLAEKAGLPMPAVGVYASPEWNAFATGANPNGALVAVSSGILEGMPPQELEAVLAHEMSHVGNGDMVTMALLQGVINAFVMFLARAVALLVPPPRDEEGRSLGAPPLGFLIWPLEVLLGIGGSLITAWFSRHREYRADAGAAQLTTPGAMANALSRLGQASGVRDPRGEMGMATFKIAAPPALLGLFASHPPLERRIEALERTSLQPARG
jgi:heat shock protein HtpX